MMSTQFNLIPGRASDSGPDSDLTPITRQSLYSLLVDDAMEEVRSLERLYRDDRVVEQKLRVEAIERAMEALRKLQEVV